MNASNLLSVPLTVLVLRNSVDFDVEIIGYVPMSAQVNKYMESMFDASIAPSSLPMIRPTRFTYGGGVFDGEPLASWDPKGERALIISTGQCFYLTEPTQGLKAAFMEAVPAPTA